MANLTCTVTKAWQLCIMDDLNGVRKRTYVIDADLLHEGESCAHFLTLSRKDNTTGRIMTMLARDDHTTGHADDGFTALSMCVTFQSSSPNCETAECESPSSATWRINSLPNGAASSVRGNGERRWRTCWRSSRS